VRLQPEPPGDAKKWVTPTSVVIAILGARRRALRHACSPLNGSAAGAIALIAGGVWYWKRRSRQTTAGHVQVHALRARRQGDHWRAQLGSVELQDDALDSDTSPAYMAATPAPRQYDPSELPAK
jgi:hypothetical protein